MVLLSKRIRFRRVALAQIIKRFSDLGGDVFKQIVAVLAKVEPLATMARLSFQDGVVQDNVEIRDCRSSSRK